MTTTTSELFNVTGKRGVITGAGGDLCGTMAEHLAAFGAEVALLDLDLRKAERRASGIRDAGGRATAYQCDVLDAEALREVAEAIRSSWGRIDFLINGAGGNHPSATTSRPFVEPEDLSDPEEVDFSRIPEESFRKVFDLNYMGTILPTQVFGSEIARAGKGSIINISSLNAITPLTKIPAYATGKAAVASFTKWLAVHYAHLGVRVNALAPGFFMTEQLRFLHTDQATGEPTERSRQIMAQTPFGRYGEPAELVGTVVWLLSEASSFVTGALIPVDGGFAAYSI